MAKNFYSAEEACERLSKTEAELKDLVRSGKIREFRDAGKVNYKVGDVDALAGSRGGPSAQSTGDIVLEPADDSSVVLAASGSDLLSLEDLEAEDMAGGTAVSDTKAAQKKKGDTVVDSVGVSVFDDDELDEQVDPLAQTAVSDVGGLGIDGVGSGSGILDLTRESDDTSLGAELLDEIYTEEESGTIEMGEATRAGIDEAADVASTGPEDDIFDPGLAPKPTAPVGAPTVGVVAHAPDAISSGLTALLVVSTIAMCFGGLGAASLVRDVSPGILDFIYQELEWFAGGSVLVGVIAMAITTVLAKRSG